MGRRKNEGSSGAIAATTWEELSRPSSYEDAVKVAGRLLALRVDNDPRAKWRIRIDRAEPGPPRIWVMASRDGRTLIEFYDHLLTGGEVGVQERATLMRLRRCEELKRLGKGRPNRAHAALANPAGQSIDVIIRQTCDILTALGWAPRSRATETGGHTSIFDAMADALRARDLSPNSYSGVRDTYYRVSRKVSNL